MPDRFKYRIKPDFTHEGKGPGEIVRHTREEAGPFLDKLELVEDNPLIQSLSPQEKVEALAMLSEMSVAEVQQWLISVPTEDLVSATLQLEREGKNRPEVIEALEAYLSGNPEEPPKESEDEVPIDPSIKAPGGGFEPYNATVEQVKEYLATDPGRLQAAVVLQAERDGKNRKGVIEALEAYIKEKANVD